MTLARLHFGPIDSLSTRERATLDALWDLIAESDHPEREDFAGRIQRTVDRLEMIGEALESYPPIMEERHLGARQRGLNTLVSKLESADDSNFELFLPTRALVGRTLVLAELNFWRMVGYIAKEVRSRLPEDSAAVATIRKIIADADEWLHGCVFTLLAEEVLGSIARDRQQAAELRTKAVEKLVDLWGNYLHWAVRDFFPLLQATWNARRSIRVSVGTTLGVSEMMRLLQAGCDPQFVEYFARENPSLDEVGALQEFLIGVSMEDIESLKDLMAREGKTCLSPEEARTALGVAASETDQAHDGVQAYRFFRERQFQAAARRLRGGSGPKRTAEEYVMIYLLEREGNAASA